MWGHLRFSSLVCALAHLIGAPALRAEEDAKKICAVSYESAQRLMRAGSLTEARKKLVLCGGPQCPETMHADCQQWLTAVEASTPTLVFRLAATEGPPPKEVLLTVDGGEPVQLDGLAVAFDPGEHEITLAANGFRTTTMRLVVSEGEKLRRETVLLAPAEIAVPTQRPAAAPSRFTTPVLIAASVAALAGLSAAYFGVKARVDDYDLDRCAPACSKSTVDSVRREYLLTNVSLGVAAAGAATATVLFLVQGRPANRSTGTILGIGVVPAGAGPMISGRF